uniref:Uncharacterized protein n=1 Tax=Tanacetum cinerariifolium TaxID=118510 RepID=A0A6L2NRY3_TANCI|nr:hypothetical protein [Tanacetum cinerariifolium]
MRDRDEKNDEINYEILQEAWCRANHLELIHGRAEPLQWWMTGPMNIVEVDVAADYNSYLVDAVVVERMALIVALVVVVVLLLAAANVDNEAGEVAFSAATNAHTYGREADMTEVDGHVMALPRLRLGTPSGSETKY